MRYILPFLATLSLLFGGTFIALAAETTGSGIILLEPSVVGAEESSRVQFGEYMSTLFTTFISVAATLAVLMIVIGGIQYITSFSIGKKEQGKERIVNAIFGLLLAVSAYLILRTINPDLVSSETLSLDIGNFDAITQSLSNGLYNEDGTRNEAHETQETDASEELAEWGQCTQNGYKDCKWLDVCTDETDSLGIDESNCNEPGVVDNAAGSVCCGKYDTDNLKYYYTNLTNKCIAGPYDSIDACKTANSVGTASCQTTERVRESNETLNYPQCSNNTTGDTGTWRYQTGIEQQAGDMSSSVTSLLSCMRGKIPDTSVGEISSISDSTHIGNLEACNKTSCSGCSHSCRSCHYGGGVSGAKSMAVDFGDEWNKSTIVSAARACDSGAYILDEGNHIHVSTSACPRN